MTLSFRSGLGSLALVCAAADVLAQDVRVAVRAGTGAVTCALRNAAGAITGPRLAGPGEGHWTWKRLPGDVVSCASAGFEPLDIGPGRGALPTEIALEMLPARAVTLEGGWPGLEAAVEWRAIPPSPGPAASVLIARQTVRVKDRLTLPVATRPRILRLRAPGASPLSLFIPAGSSPLTLHLPRPGPGGEVFGMLPAHAFSPVALELTAAGGATFTAEPGPSGAFSAAGLPPGPLTLVPRYRGGLRGRAHPLVVQAGQSLEFLPLALPEVGALSLAVAPEACGREQLPARLSVLRMAEGGRPAPVMEETVADPPCDRELEGLGEGTYEAVLSRPGERPDVLASARGHVSAGEQLALPLAAPEVRLSGRVTFGEDRPAAGLILTFDLEEQSWTTKTDDGGEYALALGAEGEYGVSIRTASGLPSASLARRFDAGSPRADFNLAETAIGVRVGRFDGAPVAEAVQLALTSKAGRRFRAAWDPIAEGEVVFVGLDFGEYWVTGTTASGLASRSVERVELSAQEPRADAEVVLDRLEGQLRVVDEAGLPVSAEVLAGEGALTPLANGTFRLAGVAMGERLRILAADHVPVCRRLQPHDLPELRVVLPRPTDRLTLHFKADLPWGSGQLLGLPGSDCPVEITELEFAEQTASDRTTVVVRVPRGRFQLAVGAATYPVTPGRDAYILTNP